jgi:hypothetical protein
MITRMARHQSTREQRWNGHWRRPFFNSLPPTKVALRFDMHGSDRGCAAWQIGSVSTWWQFPATSARWIISVGSIVLAEAEALKDGIRLIPGGTREHIVVETDSLELPSLWKNIGKHRSNFESHCNHWRRPWVGACLHFHQSSSYKKIDKLCNSPLCSICTGFYAEIYLVYLP